MRPFYFLFFSLAFTSIQAQNLRINEAMASNVQTIFDEDGESSDWLEIYNAGSEPVNLNGYAVSDDSSFETPWTFPSFVLNPDQYLLVFASDKNRVEPPVFWKTVVDMGDEWKYLVPDSELPTDWNELSFHDNGWSLGKTSIGYGDGDDSTLVDEGTISVFLRKTFDLATPDQVTNGLLQVDYDDGFVAYLNGTEIARSGLAEDTPAWDAQAEGHEAVIFDGGLPESFVIDHVESLLREGENVLAVQVHNAGTTSSDMTIIPILSFGSTEYLEGERSEYLITGSDYFHTNFKLSSSGDSIFIRNPEGLIIDTLLTGELSADISIGLASDGSDELLLFDEPTPGKANSINGYSSTTTARPVIFSLPAGTYSGLVEVAMSTDDEDSPIYYTLDGSIPTVSSTPYTNPITITDNTVLKARVINGVSLPGKVSTASYLIGVDHDLPIVSLSVDPYDFFDETDGIYVFGPNASFDDSVPYWDANFHQNWERPVHVEMFEKNGEKAFSANAGAKIFGSYSRAYSQKSLSIFFRDSYGDGPISYQLFPDQELEEYSSIVLRNSGNDWSSSMMRDGLMTTLFHESVDKQAFRPAVVYINGTYWGIHNIREKVNEHFLANHHQIDSDSITILWADYSVVTGGLSDFGALYDYLSTQSFSNEENYEDVQRQVDIMNYIYFFTANIFMNNYDWPNSNLKLWRDDRSEGKWRWIAYDKDAGFDPWRSRPYTENTLDVILNGEGWPASYYSTIVLRELLENEGFKNLFINTYADQLNTTWRTEVIHDEIDEMSGLIDEEMPNHINRWQNNAEYGNASGLYYEEWVGRIDDLYTYATHRPGETINHFIESFGLSGDFSIHLDVSNKNHGWARVNTIQPDTYPWEGTYFNGVPVEVEALPMPGYRFVEWDGSENVTSSKIQLTTTSDVYLKAIFEEAGEVADFLVINEINYNASDEDNVDDWVELFNKDSSPINLSGWILKDNDDTHTFEFPQGTTIGGRGYLVVCADTKNFAFYHPSVSTYVGNMGFGLSGGGDCVRLFDSSGLLVEEVCYDDELPWPEEADGQGSTLALSNPNLDNTDPANWYAQSGNGNPGAVNLLVTGLQEINPIRELHIYPNPASESVQITFELSRAGKTDLSILDLSGGEISQLTKDNLTMGTHELTWKPSSSVASGIYLIRLAHEDGVFLKKLVLDR